MPINHQVNFNEKKCPKSYEERLRRPTCLTGSKPFTPHSRSTPFLPPKPQPSPKPPKPTPPKPKPPSPMPPKDLQSKDQPPPIPKLKFPDGTIVDEFGTMTEEEYNAAAMSRTAYIQFNEGSAAAADYAANNVTDGWIYDDQLSNSMAVVFGKDGKAAIAYRGTQSTNLAGKDWVANYRNALGLDKVLPSTEQERIIANQLRDVELKYPAGIDLTTGHSRGGAESIKTAMKTIVRRVINFNSASYMPDSLQGTNSEITQLRSVGKITGDIVSARQDAISSRRVKSIASKFGDNPAVGLHDLKNFERNPEATSSLEKPNEIELQTMSDRREAAAQELGLNTEQYEAVKSRIQNEHIRNPTQSQVQQTIGEIELTDLNVSKALSAEEIVAEPSADRTAEFGELEDSLQRPVLQSKPNESKIGNALSSSANMAAGLAGGILINQALEAGGSKNVVANTALSGAGGGAIGAGAQMAAKSAAESVGLSVSETLSQTVAKGLLQGAAEGGVGALVALPVQMGAQAGLTQLGVDKFAAMPIAGALAGGVAGGGIAAGAAAFTGGAAAVGTADFWNPVGWAAFTMAGIGAGVSGIFALVDKNKEKKITKLNELQKKFLENQTNIMDYKPRGGLTDDEYNFIKSNHGEFFGKAKEAFDKEQTTFIETNKKLRQVESKYATTDQIKAYDMFYKKQLESANVTHVGAATVLNLAGEDKDFIEQNDPDFFKRLSKKQTTYQEEMDYLNPEQATYLQYEGAKERLESEIKKDDPTFFLESAQASS
tara:strand:+ start:1032 stop:3347 length:2316 start_codon:yes stop_codon:yes gene_type:complete